ncbi:MAG: DUF6249 domain-containing protein, partial [Pseudonocardiaceae bacterium]
LVAIIFVFGTPVILVASILFYRMRKTRLLHATIATMVEKGQPVPRELFDPPSRSRSDLRTGIILFAVGAGMVAFFVTMGLDVWGLGLIPLLIGIGYLIAWKLESGKKDPATPS